MSVGLYSMTDPLNVTNASLRDLERQSIRDFVVTHRRLLTGHVLDVGCGREPYRDIVETVGGTYIGYDRAVFPANVSGQDVGPDERQWGDLDAILFLQVAQYVPDLEGLLGGFCDLLRGGDPGVLVATGPTTWPVVEEEDLHRHTVAGIRRLLTETGFRRITVEERAAVTVNDLRLPVGWQAVAYA